MPIKNDADLGRYLRRFSPRRLEIAVPDAAGTKFCVTAASHPLSGMELVEFRMTVDAAIWGGNGDVSAPVPHKLTSLFDGRGQPSPF
jgi:hypothetical protein